MGSAELPLIATAHVVGSVKLHHGISTGDGEMPVFQLTHEFKDHFFPVNDVHFAQRNPWMATCANDTIVNLFDIEKGQLCRSFIGGHQSFVTKCLINKQENMLLSAGADCQLYMWDIRQNKFIYRQTAHPEPITALDISFDSSMIVTAAYDGYVRLWDTHKAACIKTIVSETGSTSAVSACQLTPNSQHLFIANMNGTCGLYDLNSNLLKSYLGHSNEEYCIDLCLARTNNLRGGRTILMTGSEDGMLCGWDLMS